MKIDASRVLGLLGSEQGFALAWCEPDEFSLVRPSILDGLFEQIVIDAAGRSGEAIGCDVAISVVRSQLGTKGMCEMKTLAELASDAERGVTIIKTVEQAQEWERGIARIAPTAARALAERGGATLLARTARARAAVEAHLKQLPAVADQDALRAWLLERLDKDGVALAHRLADGPGVLQDAGARSFYEVACLAVVLFEVRNQGLAEAKLDPLEDRELMWRIQLLVDRLEARTRSADHHAAETTPRAAY